jgi:hypothetical protein
MRRSLIIFSVYLVAAFFASLPVISFFVGWAFQGFPGWFSSGLHVALLAIAITFGRLAWGAWLIGYRAAGDWSDPRKLR